jgi:hypothetical protein
MVSNRSARELPALNPAARSCFREHRGKKLIDMAKSECYKPGESATISWVTGLNPYDI